jgi:hypothetical protein
MGEAIAQPIINERYIINSEETSVFSSVISTDSCYYVVGYQTRYQGLKICKVHLLNSILTAPSIQLVLYPMIHWELLF